MENERKGDAQKELHLESHLCMVIIFTIMSAALFAETLIMSWELWTLPVIGAGVVIIWWIHITQTLTERFRVFFYLFITVVELFFYGSHSTSLYDMPILTILVLGTFALSDEDTVPFWIAGVYLLVLAYHFTDITSNTSSEEISRLGLDVFAVTAASFLTMYAIRRRKEEHRRYKAMTKELIDMNERTENFLTNVSHELRTPINAVSGITEVLLKNEKSARKRDSLLAVQQAGRRLFSQISDILDYTEIDTSRLVVVEEPYMISSLINDILTEVQLMHYADDLELIFDVDTQIPASLVGDSGKVKKILRHLIENGCKFTKEGGVYVHVQTFKKDYGVNLCLSICDTGIGIAEKERSQITSSFYQTDAGRARKSGGLGLGLPIVQGLSFAMGGFMHIDEALGGGTLVRVSIPQKVADNAPCMSVAAPEKLCVACFLKPEKYSTGAIRDYYSSLIDNLASSLHISLHRVSTLRDLKNVQKTYALTHVFVGNSEYADSPEYYEGLPEDIVVAVVAAPDFVMPAKTRTRVIWKPFNSIPIVSILNNEKVSCSGVHSMFQKRFVCPSVRSLVVDDDEMNLIVAKGILGDYRMNVTTVTSGAEALQVCARQDFDIIFMDHMMPEMDGVETMHQLKKLLVNRSKMPAIVALTANAVSGAREMFMQEGFDGFVPKPIETNELEHVLRKVLPVSAFELPSDNEPKEQISPAAAIAQASEAAGVPVSRGQKNAEARSSSASADSGTVTGSASKAADSAASGAGSASATSNSASSAGASASGDWLSALTRQGVNTTAAVGYCANSEEFYREMLEKYVSDAPVRTKDLESCFAGSDLNMYAIKVHALKSASKTVGLDSLYDKALELELAAKAGNMDCIREKHAPLLEAFASTVAGLCGALGIQNPALPLAPGKNAESSGASSAGAPALSGAALTEKLTGLLEALDTFEADKAEALIAELSGAVSQDTAAAISEVKALISDFELSKAAERVRSIVSAQEGK